MDLEGSGDGMPTFVEFDKLSGMIKRLLISDERPPDSGSLSYQILPLGMHEVDLSGSIDVVRMAVADHFGQTPPQKAIPGPQEPPGASNVDEVG